MIKETIVKDNFGKQVQIGDIIAFAETFKYRGVEKYGTAMATAVVMEITNKALKIAPLTFTKDEYYNIKERNGIAVYSKGDRYLSTGKKKLEHRYNAFYIIGHGDGAVVLSTM